MHQFKQTSTLPVNVKTCFKWHEQAGALERCIPPWEHVQVIKRTGSIQPGGSVELIIHPGGIPLKWISHHIEYERNVFFKDIQFKGPFKSFSHTHNFYREKKDTASTLVDDIRYELPGGPIGNLFHHSIHRQLEQSFRYRHHMLYHDLAMHQQAPPQPLTIRISGASGLIGQNLVPFLTTGGHRVIKLVRCPPSGQDELYWNPGKNELDLSTLDQIDAVINLSGENIGEGRWTVAKKKKIIDSRMQTTRLLVKKIQERSQKPQVFLSSSAIGYYGNRGLDEMSETSVKGDDFISDVCDSWEKEALKAADDMRVVTLRIGVVLTPKGGALARLLTPAKFGLGGPLGHGRQIISWISMNDLIYSFHHCLFHTEITGPINLTGPNPVSNRHLAQVLGKKLKRPSFLPIPAKVITLAFGQMGKEIPLASTAALPEKLIQTGFHFSHATVDTALNYLIGTIPLDHNHDQKI
ncbi:MAG: TIGR01777 family oxidoreductase [Spirochaetales bacterium]|jgi:uncharacterized protein (TIGR01777 family)|nr:TIGR01777 family oxidoreductase [Spirochaetales bacterium]